MKPGQGTVHIFRQHLSPGENIIGLPSKPKYLRHVERNPCDAGATIWRTTTAPCYTRTGFFLGLNGHIRAYVKSHPDWDKEDHAKIAHQFVEMEIAAHPDLVGPPISELEINKDGRVHWLAAS